MTDGKQMFDRADFQRLASQLAATRGRFILSLNDLPEVRSVFADFFLAEVKTTYTINRPAAQETKGQAGDLLISNCQKAILADQPATIPDTI